MSQNSADPVAEVVVVGAGPAGLAAATQAAAAGCAVTVIDTYATPGGQYHRTAASGLDQRAVSRGEPALPAVVAAFSDLVAGGRVTIRSATTIWTAAVEDGPAPFRLHLTGSSTPLEGSTSLCARSVILATGATDRVLPFPGWDLPGVFTAGGAQALLKGQGMRVGRNVVVGGSGPFLLPVAAGLATAGCDVREVVEAQPLRALIGHPPAPWRHRDKLGEAARYAAALSRHRVAFRSRSAVTAAAGEGRVEEVTISRLGADWSPIADRDRVVAVDAACVSFGFVAQVGLAALLSCDVGSDPLWGDPAVTVDEHQATTVPGVFAAGEITGVTGSDGAAAEGAIAGLAAAAALGRIAESTMIARTGDFRRARTRHRQFAAILARMYRRPTGWLAWLRDDTVVCRCEEVPHRAVRDAITELAATDVRSIKLTTRCGMGYCQGRMCGEAVGAILRHQVGDAPSDSGALSTPPLLVPVELRQIAALADEPRGQQSRPLGPTQTEPTTEEDPAWS